MAKAVRAVNILVVNLGNTLAKASVVRGKGIRSLHGGRGTALPPLPDAGALAAVEPAPDGIALASVVEEPRTRRWLAALRRLHPGVPLLRITPQLDMGIPVTLAEREKTGTDRFANAVAAESLCGAPVLAIDFGTATTFNLVLPEKGFVGGAIAPGFGLWFDSLHRGTAHLPPLAPGGNLRKPWGDGPESAIRLGARWGFRGMVAEIAWQLAKAAGGSEKISFVTTGGWAEKALHDCGLEFRLQRDLTAVGAAILFLRNAGKAP
jgi:type III pantothenate kinase